MKVPSCESLLCPKMSQKSQDAQIDRSHVFYQPCYVIWRVVQMFVPRNDAKDSFRCGPAVWRNGLWIKCKLIRKHRSCQDFVQNTLARHFCALFIHSSDDELSVSSEDELDDELLLTASLCLCRFSLDCCSCCK